MGKNSSENYLDQLLFSMDGGASSAMENDLMEETPEDAIERELFGVDHSQAAQRAKDEEEFLREFEEELLKDDIPNHEKSLENDYAEVTDTHNAGREEMLDDMIDRVAKQMDEHQTEVQEEPVVDENAEFEGELPEEDLDQAVNSFDEEPVEVDTLSEGEDVEELPLTDDGELDLSGLGDSDLLDMLSGDGDLSDLGNMLSDEAKGNPLDGEDSIGNFAEAEMAAVQQSEEETSDGKKKKKDRKKKDKEGGGFFSKLSKVVFGEDEDEEPVAIAEEPVMDVSELSEENQQILAELEAAGADVHGKKKKEKKKKKKEPKPKKEKKPKPEKPKKKKKPKEVDNTPPLPKKPVIAIFVMIASLFGFVMLMTNQLGYQMSISQAKEVCDTGDYVTAYQNLQGVDIKEKDESLYYKLAALAAISEKYNSYLIFQNNGKQTLALDALVCAYGRCEINRENAKTYEFEPELEELQGTILKTLLQEYNLTGDEVLQIYQSKTRKEYTLQMHEVLKRLGLEQETYINDSDY